MVELTILRAETSLWYQPPVYSTMFLRPYHSDHFPLLSAWITDPDLLFQFAGPEFTFPIAEAQLRDYQATHPDRQFYIAYADDAPYAFGEIIPQEPGSVRLGRLLVGPAELRGRGLGTAFVRMLMEEAALRFLAQRVDLYVWERNAAAIRCYEQSGFTFTTDEPFCLIYRDRIFNILKMSRPITEHR